MGAVADALAHDAVGPVLDGIGAEDGEERLVERHVDHLAPARDAVAMVERGQHRHRARLGGDHVGHGEGRQRGRFFRTGGGREARHREDLAPRPAHERLGMEHEREGTRKPAMPSLKASIPVAIISDPAMFAAANAPNAGMSHQ